MDDPKKVMFEANAQCCDIMNHLIKEETMKEKEEKSANHVFDTEIISFDIAQRDKYELDLQGKFKVVLREGVYYVERIKPQYPKTYVECCDVLIPDCVEFNVILNGYNSVLLEEFGKLLICRDAYWKLADNWKPDWNNISDKHCIYVVSGEIWLKECQTRQFTLAFPTEEMRDAFYENFKSLIEECKELL